jgi:hypothetical protein
MLITHAWLELLFGRMVVVAWLLMGGFGPVGERAVQRLVGGVVIINLIRVSYKSPIDQYTITNMPIDIDRTETHQRHTTNSNYL